ncbi:MAG TPA: GNAT family protein [Bacteroidia bacterium]|jgi:ribosomal-protein-alanine N-acetyltransferase|nr:GNAT family protein [Bacteroidia bacterium]
MQLTKGQVSLKPPAISDAKDISLLANNRKVSINMRDRFPYPYTEQNALDFIANQQNKTPAETFGIFYNDKAIGLIGLFPQEDVYRFSAELGYWIGEPYWGKGITPDAINLIVPYAFDVLKLTRIYADIFDSNPASMRVLEKCGFTFEGVFKKSVFKDGKFLDSRRYAIVR